MLERILLVLFVLYALLTVVTFSLHHRLLGALRQRHPEVWQRLGSPTLFLNNSIANGRAVQQFLRAREDQTLGDADLSRLSSRLRVLNRFSIPLFVLFAILLLFGQRILELLGF